MLFERTAISKKPEQVAEGENPLFGRILYAGKKEEQIELLELDRSGIHVAQLLHQNPHAAIELSRQRLETEGGHSCPPKEKASICLTTQRSAKTKGWRKINSTVLIAITLQFGRILSGLR